MTDFRTKVEIPVSKNKISHQHSVMMLGSCFAESIGKKLSKSKFQVDINPFGVIYNPISVLQSIDVLLEKTQFTEEDLKYHNGLYFSFYHHSDFSNVDSAKCLASINERLSNSKKNIIAADYLIITLGTSFVYKHIETNKVVSNCHKIPAAEFERFRLEPIEIAEAYSPLLSKLFEVNQKLNIIFTASPVRHWKDGAHCNQLSKSVLLLAIEQIVNKFEQCSYFPSYEIILDELRDYRFYTEDMLHIASSGVNYIWQLFLNTYCNSDTLDLLKQVNDISRAYHHRPFQPNTKEHKAFKQKYLDKTLALKKKYLYLQLSNEIDFFSE